MGRPALPLQSLILSLEDALWCSYRSPHNAISGCSNQLCANDTPQEGTFTICRFYLPNVPPLRLGCLEKPCANPPNHPKFDHLTVETPICGDPQNVQKPPDDPGSPGCRQVALPSARAAPPFGRRCCDHSAPGGHGGVRSRDGGGWMDDAQGANGGDVREKGTLALVGFDKFSLLQVPWKRRNKMYILVIYPWFIIILILFTMFYLVSWVLGGSKYYDLLWIWQ